MASGVNPAGQDFGGILQDPAKRRSRSKKRSRLLGDNGKPLEIRWSITVEWGLPSKSALWPRGSGVPCPCVFRANNFCCDAGYRPAHN